MNTSQDTIREHVYLIGRQPLMDYIDGVKRGVVGGRYLSDEKLADDWRRAREHMLQLQVTEAGWADGPSMEALPPRLTARAEAFVQNPAVKKDLALFDYDWRMVELDRLVVYQNYVDLGFVAELESRLPANPSDEDIFDFIIGHSSTPPEVDIERLSTNEFRFSSSSNDLRYLETLLLGKDAINDPAIAGTPAEVIGVCVGYSINFPSALHAKNRLVLANKTHHAVALRRKGITHVPFVIRRIRREEEFGMLRVADLRNNSDIYLNWKRPPVFKDYFDRAVSQVFRVRQQKHVVLVKVTIESSKVLR
jgi:hypothetical protein